MGRLKKYIKPAALIAAVTGPVGAMAAVAKTIAPKSSVTDLIATASPAAIPLIENEKIKMAAVAGYSVAAIAGGGIMAANAAAAAGAGTAAQTAAGAAGSAAAAKGAGAALENESVAGYLAGDPVNDIDPFAIDDKYMDPDFDASADPGDADPGDDSGFSVSSLVKGGAAILSGLAGKKKTAAGAPARSAPGADLSLAGIFSTPIGVVSFLAVGGIAYLIYKRAVK